MSFAPVLHLPTVDSTNREAFRQAESGAPHGTLVYADEQTAGRGRRGRGWVSQKGDGLFCSLLLRPDLPSEFAPRLSLLAAVAMRDALETAGCPECGIKWPNDLVLAGKKLAGILCEVRMDGPRIGCAVLGVGVNLRGEIPQQLCQTATNLAQNGFSVEREILVETYLASIEMLYPIWKTDFPCFLQKYRSVCLTLGKPVRVLENDAEWTGMAMDVTEDGALLIREGDTIRRVLAGDVSVRGLMGYV